MKNNKTMRGHLLAVFTIAVWGSTFMMTKVLLLDFSPFEIIFARYVLALLVMLIAVPKFTKLKRKSDEIYFIAAGIVSVPLYSIFENVALSYTTAANVSIMVSTSPFFTAVLEKLLNRKQKIHGSFFVGLVVALVGVALISFNGVVNLELNPTGDLLALCGAFLWAVYSILLKKTGEAEVPAAESTKKIFLYGVIGMLATIPFIDYNFTVEMFLKPVNLASLLFLTLIASAVCFATWNMTIRSIGTIKASVYIYFIPVVATITAFLFLDESITIMAFCGIVLVIVGLLLSKYKELKTLIKK